MPNPELNSTKNKSLSNFREAFVFTSVFCKDDHRNNRDEHMVFYSNRVCDKPGAHNIHDVRKPGDVQLQPCDMAAVYLF